MPEKPLNAIPRQIRDQYQRGKDAFQRNNFDYAIEILSGVLKMEPGFFDARQALRALKASGAKTAILSNGSPRMLEAAVGAAGIGADLDAVLSVDTIRIYKPQPPVYAMVTDRFKVAPADVAFVSSNRWDVMGATAFGFRCIWVNRANLPDEYPEFAPAKVVRDLASLATLTL